MTGWIGRIGRIGRFVQGSHPPVPSMTVAVLWACGVSGLFAAVDPDVPEWRPGAGTAVAAVTLFVSLLLLRALDDIRDLDYDRRFHPERPLAAGVVRAGDLAVLYGVGVVALGLLNAAWPWRAGILLVQLAYAAGALLVYRRWRRPSADKLFTSLLVSLPAPVLLHLYLYAGYLDEAGHRADRYGLVAVAVVVLAAGHPELAGKITRTPEAGERTYVTTFGLPMTVALALAVPVLAVCLLAGFSQAPDGWTFVAVLPLVIPALAAWSIWRGRLRWPRAAPPTYLLLTFASHLALGLTR